MAYATIIPANLIVGPARCAWSPGGATFFTQDSFNVNMAIETFDIRTDGHGKLDERVREIQAVAAFTPEGVWNALNTGVSGLWPYASTRMGASIYNASSLYGATSTDATLAIHANDGELHTLKRAAITRMPSIRLSSQQTMVGEVEFTGLRMSGSGWSSASSVYTIGTTSSFASAISAANIPTQPYMAIWASGVHPIGDASGQFESESGFTIDFELATFDVEVDSIGIIDKRIQTVGVMAKCIPVGPSASSILAALKFQGETGAYRGRTLAPTGDYSLRIEGMAVSGTYVTLAKCGIKSAGFRFGSTVLRQGEIGFVAFRTVDATGGFEPLWTMGVG